MRYCAEPLRIVEDETNDKYLGAFNLNDLLCGSLILYIIDLALFSVFSTGRCRIFKIFCDYLLLWSPTYGGYFEIPGALNLGLIAIWSTV